MMADALMKYETIDADQIGDIMSGRTRASRVTGRVVPVRRPPRTGGASEADRRSGWRALRPAMIVPQHSPRLPCGSRVL